MTRALQGIFLADGSSDLPLAAHIERICLDLGSSVALTAINPSNLPPRVRRTVAGRLQFFRQNDIRFDIAFVHRDAEAQDPDLRFAEVLAGSVAAGVEQPVVAVVPIRMTEAWLLLDEAEIGGSQGGPAAEFDSICRAEPRSNVSPTRSRSCGRRWRRPARRPVVDGSAWSRLSIDIVPSSWSGLTQVAR